MENSLLDFVIDNWVLLTVFVGIFIISRLIVHMDRYMVRLMRLTVVMLLLLAAADYVEAWTSTFPVYTVSRGVLSAIGYSLRPAVLLIIIYMILGRQKPIILLPALLNTLICFLSVFTEWVFGFTEANAWFRGPLGFVPFVAGGFYLAVLLIQTARSFKTTLRETWTIYAFIAVNAAATLAAAILFDRHEIFNADYAVEILLYDLFVHVQLTKHDSLTGLLNRQSYYNAIKEHDEKIRGAVSIDMNELKWINDHEGHQAGDEALKAISACFQRSVTDRERIFRVGGDEFFILSRRDSEEKLREIEKKLREELAAAGCSCSIGCAFRQPGEDPEALCKRADEEMYEDKALYYNTVGRDRRRV